MWFSLALTIFVAHAFFRNEEEEMEALYMDLERFYREDHIFFKVIVVDFNARINPRRTAEELHTGTHEMEWNEQGKMLSEFIMSTDTIHVFRSSTVSTKPTSVSQRVEIDLWSSGNEAQRSPSTGITSLSLRVYEEIP
ncbi:hypothetical protein V3C99_008214 [Haemonchus contortus]|uniref:Salivary lipocalin n=1 Tax=Haemonchus contortus TaxID=6289 RepID=A0A7I5EB65_HAECO